MTIGRTRYQVITHEWNDQYNHSLQHKLLGMADSSAEAEALVAAHAAETGTPNDHRHYEISVAPWPDPETMARDYVAKCVRNKRSIEDVMSGREYSGATGYTRQVGGPVWNHTDGIDSRIDLKRYELYCRVGFEWELFDLRKLFADAEAGVYQAALL